VRALLQSAGFTVQGNRASCVHCNGTARLTVSFTADVAFCHRCKWAQNKVQLARGLGRTVHAEESTHRRARLRVEAFRKWLSAKYSELANRERRLARRAEWAKVALIYFPDFEAAWEALAQWYHQRRALEAWFEIAQCKEGRIELFKHWVASNG